MDEIKMHENQTDLGDFLEDYENQEVYKCKKCQWQTFKKGDYVCANPNSEYINQDVLKTKGCNDYSNEHEVKITDDEYTVSISWN